MAYSDQPLPNALDMSAYMAVQLIVTGQAQINAGQASVTVKVSPPQALPDCTNIPVVATLNTIDVTATKVVAALDKPGTTLTITAEAIATGNVRVSFMMDFRGQ